MRAEGNGLPRVCANNLLRIIRGEVPYERVKGIDPNLIDLPAGDVRQEIQQDALWAISTYEPRVIVSEILVAQEPGTEGGYSVTADVTETEV